MVEKISKGLPIDGRGNLMLARKPGESIVLRSSGDPEVTVTIVRIDDSGRAIVSVKAGRLVRIIRGELTQAEVSTAAHQVA
jgi:sRNA-binding carbon storage regulator CsrA